jgi:hypothetical protein
MTDEGIAPELMNVQRVPLDALTLDPANVREHGEANYNATRASLVRFKQRTPIIVRRDGLVVEAGNLRVRVARDLGWSHIAAVIIDDDAVTAASFGIADNRTAELAEWGESLGALLLSLRAEDEPLDELGWSDAEIDALLADAIAPTPERPDESMPEISGPVDSVTGHWYELGPHRLYCGDCRDVEWGSPGCLIYDPPWDADVVSMWSPPPSESVLAFSDGARIGDALARFGAPAWVFVWDCVSSWYTPNRPLRRMKLCAWFGTLGTYNQEGAFYLPEGWDPLESARTVSNTRGDYEYTPHPQGRRLSDIYTLPITKFHATQPHRHAKPVEWVRCLIANTSSGLVVDPFAGGGSSLLAAHSLGREWVGSEFDPAWCDVIRKRWSDANE